MHIETIYKKDTKGKIRVLHVSTDGSTLIQESGLLDGKLVVHTSVCTGKNLGKVNETTPEDQASLQAAALIVKKLKEGYFNTPDEALNHVNLMPMLAVTLNLTALVYPVMVQPKLDGIRMVGTNKQKLSRKNREITTLDHIDLSTLPDGAILDGELYNHELTFQQNTRLIKKYRAGETETIKYHVYDMPSSDNTFAGRSLDLSAVMSSHLVHVVQVQSYVVRDKNELYAHHAKFLQDGYEGTMVRTLDTRYEFNKRSKSLIKMKDFKDEAYRIINIIPSEKEPTHGKVQCITEAGKIFTCGSKLSHVEREELLINKDTYIGQTAEVRFFEFTDDGIPRFPVFICVRLDK